VNTNLEIRDLRQYTSQHLRPLLETEGRIWNDLLLWDYSQSIEYLLQYLDQRILPGYVALHPRTRQVIGYCFCVYEANKAVIGDAFTDPGLTNEGIDPSQVIGTLLTHLIETLQNSPGVDRIESQLLLHGANTLAPPFRETGFRVHHRLLMQCSLHPVSDAPLLQLEDYSEALSGLRLQRWTTTNFQPAGELVHRSYIGHADSAINDQYRTLQGSLRFLHNVVRFPGCGVFDAESSWTLTGEHTGVLEGLILCSRVRPQIAHITQLCIAPDLRGRHLGRILLQSTATNLVRRGFDQLTLTVTEDNTPALNLYHDLGFTTRHTFDAMVWSR